jgi:hypothetical protein
VKPLETEYKDWTIRVITRSTGRAWSALVEAWPPGKSGDDNAELVPHNATAQNEKAAQEAGRLAAVRFIDARTAKDEKPAKAEKPAKTEKPAKK